MIINAYVHWLPEDLFADEALRDSSISFVPDPDDRCGYLKLLGRSR
jgi:hypothetical protein